MPTAKDLIELPGFHLFKIIVKPGIVSEDRILELARAGLARDIGDPKMTSLPSRHGKYRSYTLKLFIESYDEIQNLYRAYQAEDGVVWVL